MITLYHGSNVEIEKISEKIMDLETGLYYQSALYNYNLLRRELTLGKIA